MLMGALTLLVLAAVPLLGGSLRRLADVSFRSAWLLPLALGLQVLVINVVPTAPTAALVPVHLATYGLAAVFVWRNRRVPGLVLLACGGAMNGVTIAANGGTLPASAAALRRAGLTPDPSAFTNSGVLEQPRLAFLGDVFAVPAGVPFANVFSIGDVVVLIALTYAVLRVCRPPRVGPPTPRAQALPVPALMTLPLAELEAELVQARRAHAAALERQVVLQEQLRRLSTPPPMPPAVSPAVSPPVSPSVSPSVSPAVSPPVSPSVSPSPLGPQRVLDLAALPPALTGRPV